MKERPILFSGEMVRAILRGDKTQTRRIVKADTAPGMNCTRLRFKRRDGTVYLDVAAEDDYVTQECPYGQPGDRLWVRETFAWPGEEEVLYRADPGAARLVAKWRSNPAYPQVKWTPSIHMPRWASRLTLEITDVRVERVSDISNDDAEREGVGHCDRCNGSGWVAAFPDIGDNCDCCDGGSYQDYFRELWDSINAKRGDSWESNPWVWAITFQPVSSPSRGAPTEGV